MFSNFEYENVRCFIWKQNVSGCLEWGGGVDRIGQETQNLFRTFFSKMYQQESRCELNTWTLCLPFDLNNRGYYTFTGNSILTASCIFFTKWRYCLQTNINRKPKKENGHRWAWTLYLLLVRQRFYRLS